MCKSKKLKHTDPKFKVMLLDRIFAEIMKVN